MPSGQKRRNGLLLQLETEKKEDRTLRWQCHCCLRWNTATKCEVCGRLESYGGEKEHLQLLLDASSLRPCQIDLNRAANRGGIINEPDARGWTSLHVACASKNLRLLRILIEKGGFVEAVTTQGFRPLHIAAVHCEDCVKLLLENGANPLSTTRLLKQTALHLCEVAPAAHALIKAGNLSSIDARGQTPLHTAALEGRLSVVREILLYADLKLITQLDHEHFSALDLAELRSHTDLVHLLQKAIHLQQPHHQLFTRKNMVSKKMNSELMACASQLRHKHQQAALQTEKMHLLKTESQKVKQLKADAQLHRFLSSFSREQNPPCYESKDQSSSGSTLVDSFREYASYAAASSSQHDTKSPYARIPPPQQLGSKSHT